MPPVERPAGVYDRFDASKQYESHLFVAGRVLQSAEVNEIQTLAAYRLKGLGDALFKDGDIVRDGKMIVGAVDPDVDTVTVFCEGGAVYVRGAVRGIPERDFTVPKVGSFAVGVRLVESIVTAIDDDDILDPAIGLRNYREPGAERLKVDGTWSSDEEDGGDFYPIYYIDEGVPRPREAPPDFDTLSLALAKYDRDSAGGTYVVSGMEVHADPDDVDGKQVYVVDAGSARVYGWPLESTVSRKVTFDAAPFARTITAEPHLASGGTERVNTDRSPISNIATVTCTKEVTETVVHGSFLGATDPLANGSVLSVIEVKQGGTTYTVTTDYLVTAGQINWSPGGAEPATGSSYTVKYRYIAVVTPESPDTTGFSVTGAVAGTLIEATYSYYVPRYDRLCLTRDGFFVWIKGVSADYNAVVPPIPPDVLALALVYQTWDANRVTTIDGPRTVTMPVLAKIQGQLDRLIQLQAIEGLKADANIRDTAFKKSVFVDPFIDDSMRDAGVSQTAMIVANALLTLPIALDSTPVSADVASAQFLTNTLASVIAQPLRTGSMLINPYQAFTPMAVEVTLTPPIDNWNTVTTSDPQKWLFDQFLKAGIPAAWMSSKVLQVSPPQPAEFLREITVHFAIKGFLPAEDLSQVQFDGITVAAT